MHQKLAWDETIQSQHPDSGRIRDKEAAVEGVEPAGEPQNNQLFRNYSAEQRAYNGGLVPVVMRQSRDQTKCGKGQAFCCQRSNKTAAAARIHTIISAEGCALQLITNCSVSHIRPVGWSSIAASAGPVLLPTPPTPLPATACSPPVMLAAS